MSFTSGQMFGAVLGIAVAFVINPAAGAAFYMQAVSIGMSIGGIIDPPGAGTMYQEGPRLGNLNAQKSEWGTHIHRLFGTYRLSGNVIWSLDLIETKHVEESGGGKGGSSAKTESVWYTYAGSWAVGFCEGEIAGISKIWFDAVLVYDGINYTSGLEQDNHTIYNGTTTQEIDWYMQAVNPDTPGYRNLVYIVFREIELENYGNKIPRVSVELVKNGTTNNISRVLNEEIRETAIATTSWCLNPLADSGAAINGIYDKKLIEPGAVIDSHKRAIDIVNKAQNIQKSYDKAYNKGVSLAYNAYILDYPYFDGTNYYICGTYPNTHIDSTVVKKMYYMNGNWYVSKADTSISSDYEYYLFKLQYLGTLEDAPYPVVNTATAVISGGVDSIMPYNDGYITISAIGINDTITTGTIREYDSDFTEINNFIINPDTQFAFLNSSSNGQTSLLGYDGYYVYIADGYDTGGWRFYKCNIESKELYYLGEDDGTDEPLISNASYYNTLVYKKGKIYNSNISLTTPSFNVWNLDELVSLPVTLASIVTDLLLAAGLDTDDFDVSEGLTTYINGYTINEPMQTRPAISSIVSAFGFDLIESDFKITLKERKSEPVGDTITNVIDFVEITRLQTTELSRSVTIYYANKDKNYDAGVQSAMRDGANTENNKQYQYAMALSDTEAKQLSEIYLYSEWTERVTFKFSLMSEYLHLVPSDVIKLQYKSDIYTVRLTKIEYATDKRINYEAVLDQTLVSKAVGSDTGLGKIDVDIQGPTNFELLDIPMIDNYYNDEGIYIACNGYFDSWKGCSMYKSINDEVTYNKSQDIINKTILGKTTSVLPSGTVHTMDKTSTVIINIPTGTLYSISLGELFNASNYIVIGSEILQYQYVSDDGEGNFTLSNLLRGRRGTEWAVGTHSIGETFAFLSDSLVFDYTASLNVDSYYKAVTFGTYIEDSSSKFITPDIVCLKPLAPSYIIGERDLSDNLTITWHRRSRNISGYMSYIELYEEAELYEIEIVGTDRVLNASSSAVTYTAAQQTEDGLTPGNAITVIVYQISGIVNRGYGSQEII